jgi:ribosome-associated heat shock protein Hsp15
MSVMGTLRIDKWLWAARLFKHRVEATRACAGGHVKLNEHNAKASKLVKVGDQIQARTPGGLRIVVVDALSDKRGPASVAQALYTDHSPPPPPRDPVQRIFREPGAGRPTKRERRKMNKWRDKF